MASSWVEATSFKGLITILDDPKVSVSNGCKAIEECLSANRDNLRGFFEQCFAPLVARIFGYSGPSWLGQVARSGKEADTRALRRLLSPSGPLFTAVYNADADGSTQFHFPRQRLPAHTQMLLATPAGVKSLATWPQYGTTLDDAAAASKGHIHVSVFQYFCYWFAFYAIKGGDAGSGGISMAPSGTASSFGSSMRRAADALHFTRGRDADPALRSPYIALLRQMLTELVPRPLGPSPSPLASPHRGGAPGAAPASPYYRSPSGKRSGDAASRGLVFYSTLLEFWLKDSDEPVNVTRTDAADARAQRTGAPSSVTPLWATSYEPPSEELLEALGELVRYATVASPGGRPSGGAVVPAQGGTAWLPMSPVLTIQTGTAVGSSGIGSPVQTGGRIGPNAALMGPSRLGAAAQPGTQALSRQLYRFFHRAFSMWPDQRTMKPLLRVFMAFVAPWQSAAVGLPSGGDPHSPGGALASHLTAHMSGLVHRVSRAESQREGGAGAGAGTANGVAGSSNGAGGAYTSDWEAHVLSNIPFYLEIFPLFLERSISRFSVRGETAVQDVVRVMGVLESSPILVDLLRTVERDFNRCAASQPRRAEGPYADLLPWMIDQAQDWQMAATANAVGDTPASSRPAPSYVMFAAARDRCAGLAAKDLLDLSGSMLKPDAQQRLRKCLERVLPLAEIAEVVPTAAASAATAGLLDSIPHLPRSSWRDVRFKGDVLQRPVTSYEIAPLVRILVAVSHWINAVTGLDRPWEDEEGPPENRLQEAVATLQRKGVLVDLRPLADVRNLFWIPVMWWFGKLVLAGVWAVLVAIASGLQPEED